MHAFDKSLTEDYTVKVILPEGASSIKLELPGGCKADSIEMGKFFGTLDYFGRPQITIKKANTVHEICDDILRVSYDFENSRDLYLEPVCLFMLILSLYVVAIVYSRLGFQWEKEKKSKVN